MSSYTHEKKSNEYDRLDVNTETAWYANKLTIQGKAQGTTFTIKTSNDSLLISPKELSDFFNSFDQELSTYVDSSLISRLNSNDLNSINLDKTDYFKTSLSISRDVFERTNGAFDPTVFPLVKIWGFFKDPTNPPSDKQIDSVMQHVGFKNESNYTIDVDKLVKLNEMSSLDFNAIAQGQSVDEIAALLDKRGQQDYFIEVGGEIKVKGANDRGTDWVIGVDLPSEENDGSSNNRKLENYLSLSSNAVATSGSYRKFYIRNGEKFSHTIDPKTGYPVDHNLLSATVIANSTAMADAYATAFMTMGVDKTLEFIEANPDLGLSVYLLFENSSGKIERAYSEGMDQFFAE
tara:strand:+ start:7534 stop:8577 length:1044 start_codon:yes stop_codon:yes gene_type:complete